MKKYAIIAIGYNRPKSMERLLQSLAKAFYGQDEVPLIISIDHSGTDEVEKCAKDFSWEFGEKKIVTYPERQGLRRHILNCGNFLKEFDAVAVFEDDVVASQGFYQYMKQAVEAYCDDERIAGISLYKHLWNVNADLPFEPAASPYDAYFMQFAQSWGQVWMKKQWFEFAGWYTAHDEEFEARDHIPEFVSGWPKTSWLKYHIKYCIEKDKFFVYPYMSLSTCFSDVGEHCEVRDSHLQVPLLEGVKGNYSLPKLTDPDAVKYDAFFERILTEGSCKGISYADICMDLYGSRIGYGKSRYVLSTGNLPYKTIETFGLEYRPQESNVLNEYPGEDVMLYDTSQKENAKTGRTETALFRFYFKLYGRNRMFAKCIADKILSKLKGLSQKE